MVCVAAFFWHVQGNPVWVLVMSMFRVFLAQLILVVIFTTISLAITVFLEGQAIEEAVNTMAVKLPMLVGLLSVLAILFRLIFRRLFRN